MGQDEAHSDRLKLAVLDAEDLAVMSAHLQDSWAAIGDMGYLPRSRRFAMTVTRIDWMSLAAGRQERRHAGFHFDCVTRAQQTGLALDQPEQRLQLLSIVFEPTDAPAGVVRLTFSGGASIKLDVECLEAEMRDLCDGWAVKDCPHHALDVAAEAG